MLDCTARERKRAADRAYYAANAERIKARATAWNRDNAERRAATLAAHNARRPEQRRARWAVENALRAGRLVKEPCLFCGALDVQAHHHDYSLPLAVTWLCARHHAVAHRRLHHGA